ncbi:MAG TPA: hypothetical protein VF353_10105, partial [Candidatus Binatia bacterium]
PFESHRARSADRLENLPITNPHFFPILLLLELPRSDRQLTPCRSTQIRGKPLTLNIDLG